MHRYVLSFPTRRSSDLKEILLRWMRSSKTEQRMVERARMILLASDGLSGKEIALKMGTREARVSKWLGRSLCRLIHRKDRKSTRLNSSHLGISYAVFCL